MSLFDQGTDERLKAAIHGSCLTIVGLMAMYNVVAYRQRPSPHLCINAMVYGVAVCWEMYQVGRHVK